MEWLDKTTRVICTRGHQCNLHLGYQLADDGSESSLKEGTRLKESLDLDAQVNILCKLMLKGRVWQSHGHKDENHTENSCRNPFGSTKEHLP
jgi:hypothetical protein